MTTTFLTADDVAKILGVSKSFAYKTIRKLNREMADQGFMTISGRVSSTYFEEKFCYAGKEANNVRTQR